MDINVRIINNGGSNAASSHVGYYLSTDETISTSDYLIGDDYVSSLSPGDYSDQSINIDVTTITPNIPAGTYYIGFIIDYQDEVIESNESDNNWHWTNPQVIISNQIPDIEINPTSLTITQNSNSFSNQIEVDSNDNTYVQLIDIKYIIDTIVDIKGDTIFGVVVPGYPPKDYFAPVAEPTETSVTLPNTPAYDWSFGCSATSAAMMAGYYDNNGFPNMYSGSTNGGVAPMTNAVWGSVVINGETRKQCPISATRQGLDGRTIFGHVDDYWISYLNEDPDPYIGNWTEHTYGDCTGDYMKTNQSVFNNIDGATTFYFYSNGNPNSSTNDADGCYGAKLFFESRSYTVDQYFTQVIYGYNGNTQGFTFNQFKQEIDAGRPVLIQVSGHTMLGYGYDDSNNKIYIHDTWDYSDHEMTWGGSYSGLTQWGVSIINISGGGTSGDNFVISNVGNGNLSVNSITDNKPWLSTSGYPSTPFNISPGNSQDVTVNIDWGQLGDTQQTGIITVTSNDPDEPSVTVTVTAIPSQSIILNPTNDNVSSSAGNTNVTVTSNVSWTVSESCSWVDCSPTQGSNNGSFTVNYEENTNPDPRNCTIEVSGNGSPAYYTLTQEGIEPFITVTSPNGGEYWEIGSIHNILWDDNIDENVSIVLGKSGNYDEYIIESTLSDGIHSWEVPTDLEPGNDYSIGIVSVDDDELYDISDDYFTISCDCDPPTSLSATPTGQTTAELYWSSVSDALGYDVRYKPTSGSSWITNSTTNNNYSISGLTCEIIYDWEVRTNCDNDNYSNWIIGPTFITYDCSPCDNYWNEKADFGGGERAFGVGFSIGAKGYIGTGMDTDEGLLKDFWEYDPETNTWTQIVDYGGMETFGACSFSIGAKGYVGTGASSESDMKNEFWEYDPNTNTWSQLADFGGIGRYCAVGFSIGSKGYLGTGSISDFGDGFKDFWEYDHSNDTWTQMADFGGQERNYAFGFSIGSKGYIGGGMDNNNVILNDFWEYDPANNSWTQKADFEGSERLRPVSFSIGNKGYVGTGIDLDDVFYKDFWEYDPSTDTWTQLEDFGGTERVIAAGFSISDKGYLGTGSQDDIFYNDFWEYCSLVNTTPSADFYGDPTIGYSPLTVLFTDESDEGSSPIISWLWDFGDGSFSSQQNPTNIYEAEGYYTVTLTVSNTYGTDSKTRTNYIHVTEGKYITVTSPNGGEYWEIGSVHDITWDDNIDENVSIVLGKIGNYDEYIIESTLSDGIYSWEIPTHLELGNDYSIAIVSVDDEDLYDESDDYFTITNHIGINDLFISNNLKVYPNPANDRLIIETLSIDLLLEKVIITNIIGKEMYRNGSGEIESLLEINVSMLNASVYFTTLYTNKGTITKKIIIQR